MCCTTPMRRLARLFAPFVVVASLSGCVLWLTRAAGPEPPERLQAGDAHMAALGFRVVESADQAPATFGRIRRVYVKGSGPRVIVLHELPGLGDGDIAVADALSKQQFEVYVPLLFGTAGQYEMLHGYRQACPSGLFNCFDRDTRHAITADLVAMANHVCGSGECGVIGMCLTGTLPLSMLDAKGVVAVVLAQPTLPIRLHVRSFEGLDISEADTASAMERAAERQASIYMLRYRGDWISGRGAFNRLYERIVPSKGRLSFLDRQEVAGRSHSTLVHDAGHPHVATQQLQTVVKALNVRLRRPTPPPS
jgi:dienelactone hydrolase